MKLHHAAPTAVPAAPRRLRRRTLLALPLAACAPWAAAAQPSSAGFYDNLRGMRLLDQDGRALPAAPWLGRVVLLNFIFTGCSTVCPPQTRALVELQQTLPAALRERVHLVSLSLDPLNDTPAALKAFATRLGCDLRHWSFVTGRPQDIERLSRELQLFRPEPGTRRPDDHSTALWLVDRQGQLRMRYAGNAPDLPRLRRELAQVDALPPLAGR